ncbi:hypothetical protein E1A91_D07G233000v1 [Gossypium mustelinum]|uniref:RING-type E3 ubiquitin transferase n=3 Tax=Gossypium TaxID=3633 RepID=A0A5J5QXU2_GOSBA|nr:hypothetical protein ES319_D07G227400v1 [Gossypium barbadense]TYG62597.1 hypothetical protein ES288_D07G244400v1 [Gossypium darwinii]TYI74847.1 hypothetical protein E1A91_D07G233000v1 [Gossypium mustelinum]
MEIVLTINVGYCSTFTPTHPFFSQRTLCLRLTHLQHRGMLRQVLAPTLAGLGINPSSTDCQRVLQEIMERGLRFVNGTLSIRYHCKALHLQSVILVGPRTTNQESLMTAAALAISESEFESDNYGMVAATESSVKEMLRRFKELGVGFEASRMPCSHIFHGDCIGKWLHQSHYCPICRFEMPTHLTDR